MGTLKIGSAKNMSGVTINPSTVLFNDNNVKYIKSGLTEIWSNIKPLVPKLTSNTGSDGGEVIYSKQYTSSYGTYTMYFAFDELDNTMGAYTNADGGYIGYKFVLPTCVKKIAYKTDCAETVKLQGSNDNNTWVDLTEQFTMSTDVSVVNEVSVNNNNAYMSYRLLQVGKKEAGGGTSFISLQFYGTQLKR